MPSSADPQGCRAVLLATTAVVVWSIVVLLVLGPRSTFIGLFVASRKA
jgi:hypothetical protein